MVFIILIMWGWYRRFVPNLGWQVYSIAGIVKLFSGVLLGVLYYSYYAGGDTVFYYDTASEFRDWAIMDFLKYELSSISLAQPSRAILFTRITAAVIYLTRGDYWIVSAYFSCFSFLGGSYLASKIICVWESLRWPVIIALFFYPTAVFWSSGLLKESLAFGGMCMLIGVTFSIVYIKKHELSAFVLAGLGGLLLITLKYYIAALVVPSLAFLTCFEMSVTWSFMPKSNFKKVVLITVILLLPALFFLSLISYNFAFDSFFEVLQVSRDDVLNRSSVYNKLPAVVIFDNTLDYLLNAFYYMFSGLFSPFVFGEWSFPHWISRLENVFTLILLGFSLVRVKMWKNQVSVELVLSICYVLVVSAMLTYAIPNLGAIARFKVYYMPFLMIPLIYTLRQYIIDKRG